MSQIDLENLVEELGLISKDQVKTPSIPVSIYIQEAEDQKVWAEEDKDALIAHGLDWTFAEALPVRAGALREAQSVWTREFKSSEDFEEEWLKQAPGAFEMRNKLLDAFRYAFRKHDDLLTNVALIAEGYGREDMIQDLNDLAVLGKANTPLLEAINFELTKLDLAAETSDSMAGLLAGAKGEQGTPSAGLDMRNRAYTYLKEAVDEVRACGKYTFADNKDRLKGYRSEFLHKQNKKSRNSES